MPKVTLHEPPSGVYSELHTNSTVPVMISLFYTSWHMWFLIWFKLIQIPGILKAHVVVLVFLCVSIGNRLEVLVFEFLNNDMLVTIPMWLWW